MKIELRKKLRGNILDIGGGGEGVIGRIYGKQVTAIDQSREELEEVTGDMKKLVMDAEKLEFPEEIFDQVTFFYSLMYMGRETQEKALREAARVLKKGGGLWIWDAEISSAFPEPFLTDLEIDADGEMISVTYGVLRENAEQSAKSVQKQCRLAGFSLKKIQAENGHFYISAERV